MDHLSLFHANNQADMEGRFTVKLSQRQSRMRSPDELLHQEKIKAVD